MIIYPPFIADTIPAFTTNKIIIPFQQNPAVHPNEVVTFKLIIKDYINSNIIAFSPAAAAFDIKTGIAEFTEFFKNDKPAEHWSPEIKKYYKFQICYVDDSDYEAFSVASIGRCIGNSDSTFNISILAYERQILSIESLNENVNTYTGRYITSILSEPIHSYRFTFKNKVTNEIIQDTGEVLHNVDNDVIDGNELTSLHNFKLRYELNYNEYYELTYYITTINGYKDSISYIIIKAGQLPAIFPGEICVEQDKMAKENGYIKISIKNNTPYRGDFVLERTSDNREWNEITKFSLTNISDLSQFVWYDCSIEQGIEYTYAIRQYAYFCYSERILSKPIVAEFEHMFLTDGNRQLKIAYNPKVSSFKDTILEQKIDTIGNKYPFFFRNNQVKYKEIPISGLISYLMDENNLFLNSEELGLLELTSDRVLTPAGIASTFDELKTKTTQLFDYNYTAERKFKLSVLDWLTNGEDKLFRSPAEGNYVIRLTNTSLSPNDTLGRLLHTFTSTGYEVAEHDTETLLKKGLLNLPEIIDPEPDKIFVTLDLNWLGADSTKTFIGQGIENIIWNSNHPNFEDKLILTKDNKNESFSNTVGIFTTPSGITFDSITVTKNILVNGHITFQYLPDLEESKGIDDFAKLVETSEDVLISAPCGTTLYGDENAVLIDPETKKITTIYKTYILVVRRDMNATYTDPTAYNLTLGDSVIDCSDGQIRYYDDLNPDIHYEKGLGLHLDIYARILDENASSKLGRFILGISKLGGNKI